ncbi:GvpL/GvpF family gas vesicle protein [Streptomyces sp. SCA3-4]|uniref:GvpL/GvpF family gas vesicle protein n=1 Tax=Streptomyces sichuanensis TaxID=2871810 RepID=UPI001CE30558|nr:GvpL/GvpF family gas vesicle protein [Streptomyces sichuanensis]MCA6094511.1 GvpL/GvpF family gas vesicle protein [Streptomyces sichuanensis]
MKDESQRYVYAYAVTRDCAAVTGALETVTGVAAEPVGGVRHLGLMALAGRVPAAEYGERALSGRMEDLPWLEGVARAHQRVVDAVTAAGSCVLPLRLATVFHDESGVRTMLEDRGEQLRSALDRLDGRTEWGVKVYAPEPTAAPRPPAPRATTSGRDYLRRRAAERHAHEEGARRADEAARGIHTTLAALAEETRLYPPQNPALSHHPGRNVLNAAYLVPWDGAPHFTSAVTGLAEHAPGDDLRLELTGPWAPYSFVTPEAP